MSATNAQVDNHTLKNRTPEAGVLFFNVWLSCKR